MTKTKSRKQPELVYALDAETQSKLVHIKDAENGGKCDCVCPSCRKPLVAKNAGAKNAPHFAHESNCECATALQTSLHYLAKEIFLEEKVFHFKKFDGRIARYNISEVVLENKIGGIIPDVILNCEGKIFIVEIFVSHPVDEEKKQKIKGMSVSAVEYDLSKVDRNIGKEKLRGILFDNPKIRWTYDADEKRIADKQKFLFENGDKMPAARSVYPCPLAHQLNLNLYTRRLYTRQQHISKSFCIDCTFFSGKNENGDCFCGAKFWQSQYFDFAALIDKNEVMDNKQCEAYLQRFFKLIPIGDNKVMPVLTRFWMPFS